MVAGSGVKADAFPQNLFGAGGGCLGCVIGTDGRTG